MKITDEQGNTITIEEGEITLSNLIGKTAKGKIVEVKNVVFSRDYSSPVRTSLSRDVFNDRRLLKKFTNGKEQRVDLIEVVVLKKVGKIIKR